MTGYPPYYDDVPPIRLYDPLADFLGAFEEGIVEITYRDCVKLAGHACPTVAGAYRMAAEGLKRLFPDTLPQRSEIRVELSGAEDEGVVGVVGHVIGYIVGAGGIGGFKGIGERFARNDRLVFGADIAGDVRLTRLDTGKGVTLTYSPASVPGDPAMKPLMQKALRGEATPQEHQRFRQLWQSRTQTIVTAHESTPFITISEG
jgi:hypothetical protein